MRRLGAVLALLACTAFGAARAEAPPAVVLQHAPGVEMRGSGTLRWLGLRIYDAVLWAAPARPAASGPAGTNGTTVADFDYTRPFALQLRSARSLKGEPPPPTTRASEETLVVARRSGGALR